MSKFFDRRLLTEAQAHRAGLALTIGLGALGGAATVGGAFALSRAVDAAFLGGLDLMLFDHTEAHRVYFCRRIESEGGLKDAERALRRSVHCR